MRWVAAFPSLLFLAMFVYAEGVEDNYKDLTLQLEDVMAENFDGPYAKMYADLSDEEKKASGIENLETANLNCYQKPEWFASCVMGLQAMGYYTKPERTLIPTKKLSDPRFRKAKVIREISLLTLIETVDISELTLSPKDRVQMIKQDRSDLLEIAKQEIAMTSGGRKMPVRFRDIAEEMMAQKRDEVSPPRMALALARGYALGLDAHSHFEFTKVMEKNRADADSSLDGIGIPVGSKDNFPMVAEPPLIGTPAEAAGILVGDAILEVDHVSMRDISLTELVGKVRGTPGSLVHLKMRRGTKEYELDVARAHIQRKTVYGKVIEDIPVQDRKLRVGYIRIETFMDGKACNKVKELVQQLESSDIDGFVLDLHRNSGGYADQTTCIGSLFVGDQPIFYRRNLRSKEIKSEKGSESLITQKPVVVEIDGGSASGSELLSGGLQGLRRAFVVGNRSFGKGSVQDSVVYNLDPALKRFFTTEQFYVPFKLTDSPNERPSRRSNQKVGVTPDFFAYSRPDANPDDEFTMRESDLYPNAIAADAGEWDQIRPEEVAKIQTCLEKNKRAESVFAEHPEISYPLLKSEEVLACQIGL